MNMKPIITAMCAAILIFAAACTKEKEYKSYDLDPAKAFATTTGEAIANDDVSMTIAGSIAISNIGDTTSIADCGIRISANPQMANHTTFKAKAKSSEFSVVATGFRSGNTYYYQAYTTTFLGGTTFGEIKSFEAPYPISFKLGPVNSDYALSGHVLALYTSEVYEAAMFTTLDKDGDGFNWRLYDDFATAIGLPEEEGYGFIASWSWEYMDAARPSLTPENYLCMPPVFIKSINGPISFTVSSFAIAFNAGDAGAAEAFKIVISEEPLTLDNCRDAEVLLEDYIPTMDLYTVSADIPAKYVGKNAYIAICHFDTEDMIGMYIDKISINLALDAEAPKAARKAARKQAVGKDVWSLRNLVLNK